MRLSKQHNSTWVLCTVSCCISLFSQHFSLTFIIVVILSFLRFGHWSAYPPFFLYLSCRPGSPYLSNALSAPGRNSYSPLVRCTSHMCPIRVHWHVKLNYKEYWRVKITISNFNYRMNYSQWNLVVQHPNFENVTQIFSFNYKSLSPYANISA